MAENTLQKRFSVAYARLCHFVALRREGSSVSSAEDGVIRAAIFLCENAAAPDIDEVVENAKAFFSLTFSPDEVNRSIDRLALAGEAERVNGGVRLTAKTVANVDRCIEASQAMERSVRDEWMASLIERGLISANDANDVWGALQQYLAALFARHGVQTLELLAPEAVADNDIDLPASEILDAIVRAKVRQFSVHQAREIVRSFLTDRTTLRNSYLIELLDGTFSFFALTVDDETRELLRKNLPPLKLLVDTNFVFGLLDLHSNPFVAVSKDLVAVIKEQKFPFQLYYHPLTVEEVRSVMAFHQRRLAGERWSSAISRALLNVGDLGGVERRFHELNAEHPTTVEDFFARYGNLERVLEGYGIKPYRHDFEPWLDDDETLNLISKYKLFIEPNEKLFSVLRHDIVLLRTLREIRRHDPGPFGSGGFFLTCDYTLWRFDHRQLHRGTTGVSVLPNVFLQLLRPFVPRTPDFDQSFVSTFALPEFRTIHSATAQAVSRVASVIRLYSDLPEELAVKILSDEVLISKVAQTDEDDVVVSELIESAIADEAKRLKQDADRLREELDRQTDRSEKDHESLIVAANVASERLAEVERLRDELAATRGDREEALRQASMSVARKKEEDEQHRIEAQKLVSERSAAESKAAKIADELGEEKKTTARLRRVIAAAAHFVIVLIGLVSAIFWFGSLSRETIVLTVGSAAYLIFVLPMELLDWVGKREHPWWGRVRAFATYALAVGAFWIGEAESRWAWLFGAAALTSFLTLIADVVPKRK